QHPLVPVGSPDADPVALLDTASHQAQANLLALRDELVVGGPVTLLRDDERFAFAYARGCSPKVGEDRFAHEGDVACPMDIARLAHLRHLQNWTLLPLCAGTSSVNRRG